MEHFWCRAIQFLSAKIIEDSCRFEVEGRICPHVFLFSVPTEVTPWRNLVSLASCCLPPTGCFYTNCLSRLRAEITPPKTSHYVPFSIWEVCLDRAHGMYNVFICLFPLPLSLSVSLAMATFFRGLSVFQRLAPRGGWTPASSELQGDFS